MTDIEIVNAARKRVAAWGRVDMDYKDYAAALDDEVRHVCWSYGITPPKGMPDGHSCPRAFLDWLDTIY